jgi:aryl-alcohol dehydrogenase-like predicted oxidoreductase
MIYTKLGNTDLEVSKICLGTMTFGEQNTEEEGHEQITYALGQGINFIDTAEMYSVPGKAETQGSTERIIGTWLSKNKSVRKDIILASKVTGPSDIFGYIAPNMGFSKTRILDAIDKNLDRLQTDYLDIYQLHWPERKTNFFGSLGYTVHDEEWEDNFEEAITTLKELVAIGKIRHWGLSNETPWGIMRCNEVSRMIDAPKCLSIQNPYNLLNRSFEVGLSEIVIREKIAMLAYSPMGFGLLSGKFHNGTDKPTDRINQFKRLARYNSAKCHEATAQYIEISKNAGISIAQMALAFVTSQPFVASNIIGATTMEQLKENIASIDVMLSNDTMEEINKVHAVISNPAP